MAFCTACLSGCSENADNSSPQDNTPPQTSDSAVAFARGADISWITEQEKAGIKFYDASGKEQECFQLMKNLGVNAVRLRVWVNPKDGWCNAEDVLLKAKRAAIKGMNIMIDFHYSDSWADPGQQTVPLAWTAFNVGKMTTAVSQHTRDVLQLLKNNDINVQWVQVGNETPDGMLWESGRASTHPANFAAYELAGYNAVKKVYPDAKVIVHVDQGDNLQRFTWLFDLLKANGGRWDIIGMSLYPDEDNWQTKTTACLSNIQTLARRYNCDVMVCEIGMPWDAEGAPAFAAAMVEGCKKIDHCKGVFYWEPQCYNDWKGYSKGAFTPQGQPTAVMNAFKE